MSDTPDIKISIVMPSYNQGSFVEAALKSVIDQDYANREIIFVDGNSTDQTMRVVRRYEEHIASICSEPDAGQSDALRKGFSRASGQVLTWLNTDDLLLPGALREVAQAFSSQPSLQWILGNVAWIDSEGNILRCRKGEPYWGMIPRMGVLSACGPSAFFTRELYESVNGVNPDLHYMMDTELWWKFINAGASYQRLKKYTWALRLHRDAKMSGHHFVDGCSKEQLERIERQNLQKDMERLRIAELIENNSLPVPPWVASSICSLHRVATMQYLIGLVHSWRWRGKSISEFGA